jgi:hypothetical protein
MATEFTFLFAIVTYWVWFLQVDFRVWVSPHFSYACSSEQTRILLNKNTSLLLSPSSSSSSSLPLLSKVTQLNQYSIALATYCTIRVWFPTASRIFLFTTTTWASYPTVKAVQACVEFETARSFPSRPPYALTSSNSRLRTASLLYILATWSHSVIQEFIMWRAATWGSEIA